MTTKSFPQMSVPFELDEEALGYEHVSDSVPSIGLFKWISSNQLLILVQSQSCMSVR